MGTAQKQKQIRTMLDALGWSHKQLADVLYEELYCSEYEELHDVDPEAVSKFQQTLKKQLQRPSTPEDRLERYVKIVSEHPEFIALGLGVVVPKYVGHTCLNQCLLDGLSEISNTLDNENECIDA